MSAWGLRKLAYHQSKLGSRLSLLSECRGWRIETSITPAAGYGGPNSFGPIQWQGRDLVKWMYPWKNLLMTETDPTYPRMWNAPG